MKCRIGTLAILTFSAAFAGEEKTVIDEAKVDLDEVVEVGEVSPVDRVTSSAMPTKEALQVFGENGYSAVIDLRGPGEKGDFDEQSVVENLGMDYVSLPIAGEQAISFENAGKLDELINAYPGRVLIHCASGNRVGALMALRESLDGAGDDVALAVGRQAGLTSLEPVVLERLAARQETQSK